MFKHEEIQLIRNQSRQIEEARTVSPELLDFMYEEKLFKLFVPEKLGGRMLSLPEALRVFQQASRIDGNFGWLVTIGSGGGMFVPVIQKHWAQQLFSPKEAVLAGSGYPSGTAKKVYGGYQVTGEWKYCSGAPYATFFTGNAIVEDVQNVRSFVFMLEQVEVIHDWYAFGLKGTGSHTIKTQETFVPEDRTFSLFEQQNDFGGPVHSFPFMPFSVASFAAVCLGISDHFFEEAKSLAEDNRNNWSAGESDRYHFVLVQVEEQEQKVAEALEDFHQKGDSVWSDHVAGKEIAEADLQEYMETSKRAASMVIQAADSLIRLFGMEAVMETSTINRVWRDLHTAGQHAFLKPS
ncbi:acyl-CoA dehydrogenase family protein [Planococcus sp. ISL-109]|uniref:acyl-CoA dehydrogenase family protein n=1 Tax=Planococcus sp. ISL-109 TaxID=2819166 RepID=UPI001BEA32B1|nr:acyl-CoA dehydrogenase family protein [Planococcus sp. ISL-109]MBT2583229.1 acyl-CoA dehydrogenase family protein [Planococcus sp. ISL-109]